MGVYEGRDSFHKFFSGLIWAFKVKGKMPPPASHEINEPVLDKTQKFPAKWINSQLTERANLCCYQENSVLELKDEKCEKLWNIWGAIETEMIMDFSMFTEARAGVGKIRWPENLTIWHLDTCLWRKVCVLCRSNSIDNFVLFAGLDVLDTKAFEDTEYLVFGHLNGFRIFCEST